ncbi:MAG: AAA family ATPase [Gemmatimonadaceae bacterium]
MRRQIAKLFRSRYAGWLFASLAFSAIAVVGVRVRYARLAPSHAPATVRYSEFLTALTRGQVDSIVIEQGSALRGWSHADLANRGTRSFRVEIGGIPQDQVVAAATAANAAVAFAPPTADRSAMINLAVTLIVTAGIGGLLWFGLGRQASGSSGSADVTLGNEANSPTTFADVAGNGAALADLREVVEFLREPKRFAQMGAKVPKGILLEGPPGTGKTLMARALAGEAGTSFFATSGPDFSGMFVGVGTMRVKALFKKARRAGGGVIFIDEIDSLGGKRGRQGGHQEDDRTLNQLLVELDGFGPTDGIIVVAATNRVAELDPALLRKGRFDRSVTISLPTVDERSAILSLHAAKRHMPLADDVELERLARLMPGTSGADLEGLLNEAAILAVRTGAKSVCWAHMEEARDRVLLGRARTGLTVSADERRLVALHEAGHAVAGLIFCPSDPLHKVTIQPRGGAMGVAFFQPDHEAHLHSRASLEGQIRKGLGGRAAEELAFGADRITSGASSDLQHTTRIAKEMVYRLGMGNSTGLMIFDPDSGPVSSEMHSRMDADVRALLEAAYDEVLALFRDHRPALEALATALLDRETLTGAEASSVLAAHGLGARTAAA